MEAIPIDYEVYPDLNIFVVSCSGTIDLREILKLLDDIEFDARIVDGMTKFLDCRLIDEVTATESEIAEIATMIQSFDLRRSKATHMVIFAPDGGGVAASLFYSRQFAPGGRNAVGVFRHFTGAAAATGVAPGVLGPLLTPPISAPLHS